MEDYKEKGFYHNLTVEEATQPFINFVSSKCDILKKYGFIQAKLPDELINVPCYDDIILHWDSGEVLINKATPIEEFPDSYRLESERVLVLCESIGEFKRFCLQDYPTPQEVTPDLLWSNMQQDHVYAVDLPVTLFKETSPIWNLKKLEDPFTTFAKESIVSVPGLTNSHVYSGSYGSKSALHTEDLNLGLVNYLWEGKKYWSISPGSVRLDQSLKKNIFSSYTCENPASHKTAIIKPSSPMFKGVPFYETIQSPGEYIIIDHGAYHQGFNLSFSICEAVNYGSNVWSEFAKTSTYCSCSERDDTTIRDFATTLAENFMKEDAIPIVPTVCDHSLRSDIYSVDKNQPFDSDGGSYRSHLKEVRKQKRVQVPCTKGRKRLPALHPRKDRKKDRGKRICPVCHKKEWRSNFVRHLRTRHKLSTKQVYALSYKASLKARSGLRAVQFNDLPYELKNQWKETKVRRQTKQFLSKYQLFIASDESSDEDEESDSFTYLPNESASTI